MAVRPTTVLIDVSNPSWEGSMVVRSVFIVMAILSLSLSCDRMQPLEPTFEGRKGAMPY